MNAEWGEPRWTDKKCCGGFIQPLTCRRTDHSPGAAAPHWPLTGEAAAQQTSPPSASERGDQKENHISGSYFGTAYIYIKRIWREPMRNVILDVFTCVDSYIFYTWLEQTWRSLHHVNIQRCHHHCHWSWLQYYDCALVPEHGDNPKAMIPRRHTNWWSICVA